MLSFYLQAIDSQEDKTKFETLYLKYREEMYDIAYRILQHEQDAEDAVHQAFLYVAENIHKIGEAICSQTRSYLAMITECRAIDCYRYKTRHREVPYNDETLGIQLQYEISDTVQYYLAKLPAQQRRVLLLKHKLGYSNKEICDMLGLSAANVRQIEKRGRDNVLKMCAEEENL